MVCYCSVPDVCPQPDTGVLRPATPGHPANAMTPPQRRQLALEALAGAETVMIPDGELRRRRWLSFPFGHEFPSVAIHFPERWWACR
jgi:hypothetical protein